MPSAVKADSLEEALAAAIRRFDGASPVTAQVNEHFSHARAGEPHPFMRLVLAVAQAEGAPLEDALDVACAVELLHNATLVHGMLREGGTSPFGLAHGINAGDALCAIAYLQLLDEPARRPAERTVLMTRALHRASYALCAGHAAEIAARGAFAGIEEHARMLEGTSALFEVACELGALVAGCTAERVAAYARFGRSYGIALQMEARADAAAAAAGIEPGGRVRDCLTDAIRSAR